MRSTHLDLDALRGFVTGVELGSFARAADRLGRSTSAISAQLKKLEAQAGVPLTRKAGRGLDLTDSGEALLAYARRLLELNDEAVRALRGAQLEGWVRLGLQEDFGEALLAGVLGRFARAHPKVRIEGRIARNAELHERIATGQLDLALAWDGGAAAPFAERIAEVPMFWLGAAEPEAPGWARGGEPLPLAALEAPCLFRSIACDRLDRAGVSWRLAFVSPSLGGLWSAVAAGLGLAVRTRLGAPRGVRVLDAAACGLPALPSLGIALLRADRQIGAAGEHLASILVQTVLDVVTGA